MFHCVDARRLEVERGGFSESVGFGNPARRRLRSCNHPHWSVEFKHARRVGNHVEHHVALRPVKEDPQSAAEDRLAFAGRS